MKRAYGFTIVELLIVIVVIAILAAISVVGYSNIQRNTRDSVRLQSIAQIQRALEIYRTEHGRYPAHIASGTNVPAGFIGRFGSSYSHSVDTAGNWLRTLKESGVSGEMPIDPINNSDYHFVYWSSEGYGACTGEPFYVLGARFESPSKIPAHAAPLNCSLGSTSANWTMPSGWAVFSNIKTPAP